MNKCFQLIVPILLVIILLICANSNNKKLLDYSETLNNTQSVAFYEYTDNNFIQGIDAELSETEILKLKDILINKTNHIKKIYNINNDNIIYEFTFYDKYDAEISSLSMDNKNRVIINRQYVLNNKDIKAYIIELIDKYDNKTHT